MAKLERLMDPPNAILRIGGRLRSTDGPMVGSIIGELGANARLLVRLDDNSRFESAGLFSLRTLRIYSTVNDLQKLEQETVRTKRRLTFLGLTAFTSQTRRC